MNFNPTTFLFLDLETTGLQPDTCEITEIGAVLYKERVPVKILSELVQIKGGIDADASSATGITKNLLDEFAVPLLEPLTNLYLLMEKADYVVTHNGVAFDFPFLKKAFDTRQWEFPKTPWLDTMVDIEYPEEMRHRDLKRLSYDHAFLNPFAHRAVFDCLTTARIFFQYPFSPILANAMQDTITAIASPEKPWIDQYAQVNIVKGQGFRWREKAWVRDYRFSDMFKAKDQCAPVPVKFLPDTRKSRWGFKPHG